MRDRVRNSNKSSFTCHWIQFRFPAIRCSTHNTTPVNKASSTYLQKLFVLYFRYLRRFHTHVLCHKGDNDFSCLMGEGTCVQNVVQRELAKRKANSATESETEFIQFTTSCSCEIIQNSVFRNLVWKIVLLYI